MKRDARRAHCFGSESLECISVLGLLKGGMQYEPIEDGICPISVDSWRLLEAISKNQIKYGISTRANAHVHRCTQKARTQKYAREHKGMHTQIHTYEHTSLKGYLRR